MEVHKHPHHVTHKKKWGEYLLEFFMLFLAVFLGFVAENIRENVVESHREKAYIKTLVEDIKLDTADIAQCIRFRIQQEKRIDSLINLLENERDSTGLIYYLARWSTRANDLYYHDRTIQQLKNSGNLRLIKNKDLSDNIILYDGKIRNVIQYRQSLENESRQILRNNFSKVFKGVIFNSMLSNDANVFALKPSGNPPLFSQAPELINELEMNAQYLKSIYRNTRTFEKEVIEYGDNLLKMIKKEYHLQNE